MSATRLEEPVVEAGAACGVEVSPENFHKKKKKVPLTHPVSWGHIPRLGGDPRFRESVRIGTSIDLCRSSQSWIVQEKSLANPYLLYLKYNFILKIAFK